MGREHFLSRTISNRNFGIFYCLESVRAIRRPMGLDSSNFRERPVSAGETGRGGGRKDITGPISDDIQISIKRAR